MASHREMQRLAADTDAVRSMASYLLKIADADWTAWEVDFLENMSERTSVEPITIRQREILCNLHENAKSFAKIDGFSVATLLRECWLARMDLSEDDEEFVERLKAKNEVSLKRRPLFRLLHCAREIGLIDKFIKVA